MFRKYISALVVLMVLFAAASAQPSKVGDYVRAEMKRQNIPGLSLAIVSNGKVVLAEGYGMADKGSNVPARAETVYKICSVSKQFIATGIMLLVQEGKVSLDDPVSKYLERTPDTWKAITIRHLLTHTSGLIREAPGFDPFKVQSDADVVRTAYSKELRFATGEKWEYSNTGYFALAEVIRKVAGRPWGEYLNDKVFMPSGMKTTFTTNTKASVPNRAVGYSDNDKLLKADDWPALRPSGAFLSTVLDLAKWDAVLYTDKVLSEPSRREMWTAVKLAGGSSYPYGFGWHIGEINGLKALSLGRNAGFPCRLRAVCG
jgi:CubicO group peptidase (beta-lactamase class C family)